MMKCIKNENDEHADNTATDEMPKHINTIKDMGMMNMMTQMNMNK